MGRVGWKRVCPHPWRMGQATHTAFPAELSEPFHSRHSPKSQTPTNPVVTDASGQRILATLPPDSVVPLASVNPIAVRRLDGWNFLFRRPYIGNLSQFKGNVCVLLNTYTSNRSTPSTIVINDVVATEALGRVTSAITHNPIGLHRSLAVIVAIIYLDFLSYFVFVFHAVDRQGTGEYNGLALVNLENSTAAELSIARVSNDST